MSDTTITTTLDSAPPDVDGKLPVAEAIATAIATEPVQTSFLPRPPFDFEHAWMCVEMKQVEVTLLKEAATEASKAHSDANKELLAMIRQYAAERRASEQAATQNQIDAQADYDPTTGEILPITEPKDELYGEAVTIVVSSGQASVSRLQRQLRIGFSRAHALMDVMEAEGVVSPIVNGEPRKVLLQQPMSEPAEESPNVG